MTNAQTATHDGALGHGSKVPDPAEISRSPSVAGAAGTPARSPGHSLLAFLGASALVTSLTTIWLIRLGTDVDIYVSGFGATGRSTALVFNTALAGVGAGGLLIAIASRRIHAPSAALAAFAWCLGFASLSFVAASRITCTLGCPIPFTADASWQDAVHVGLACLGFGLAIIAILISGKLGAEFRRLVWPTVIGVAIPAATGGFLSLLGVALGLGGWLELVATTVALSWLIVAGVQIGVILRAQVGSEALVGVAPPADKVKLSVKEDGHAHITSSRAPGGPGLGWRDSRVHGVERNSRTCGTEGGHGARADR